MKKVYPLAVTDALKECAAFYVELFGFTVVFDQDWYQHLVHESSGAELGFMAPNMDNQPKELHPAFGGDGQVYSFEVDDAGHEYARLSEKPGLEIVLALKDEPWGQRHFILRDPAGIYVDVIQPLGG